MSEESKKKQWSRVFDLEYKLYAAKQKVWISHIINVLQ